MSKKNDDFFVEKKTWSIVKDELLGCYLKPYTAKILHTRKPLIYVDCFAGKGRFDDGTPGSPIIALNIFKQSIANTRISSYPMIEAVFIDLNYAAELKANLNAYDGIKIINGAYEDTIDTVLQSKAGRNVFLYIDPYGIKSLDCNKFDTFANGQFNSIELLINMNSFGFIREACNVMGTKFKVDDAGFFDDLIEYETANFASDTIDKSTEALNRIAGGDYWQEIIMRYKSGEIDGYDAEEYFSALYCQRLSKSYKYVLNMPIRIRQNQHPKYRMIHATNHPEGCILMADNICNRGELLKKIQNSGQLTLFQEIFNSQVIDENQINNYITEHFSKFRNWISITTAHALFFVKYGVICKTGYINKVLKTLEKDKKLEIVRNPNLTEKGKTSTFMTESGCRSVSVKWVK